MPGPITLILKSDNTTGNVPLTTELALGEVGINTFDGKMYIKKDDGTESVILINAPRGFIKGTTDNITIQSGTTTIPFDDTAPLITEGTEIVTSTLTPYDATTAMDITWSVVAEGTQNNQTIVFALFRDSVCISAVPIAIPSANNPVAFTWQFADQPATTLPVTYSLRIGVTNGTWTVSTSSAGSLGGVIESGSCLVIAEYHS